MPTKNVFIIGSGNLAKIALANLATAIIGENNQLHLTIYNPNIEHAKGLVLDAESSSMSRVSERNKYPNEELNIIPTNKLEDLSKADLIVIMSGKFPSQEALAKARLDGTDRDIQAVTNHTDLKIIATAVKLYNPNAFILMVTNPVDYFTQAFQKMADHNPQKIIGFGGAMDSHRFLASLKKELELTHHLRIYSLAGHIVGYHNKDMFPLTNSLKINGKNLVEFISSNDTNLSQETIQATIEAATRTTRGYGGMITELNKNKVGASVDAGNLIAEFILSFCFGRVNSYTSKVEPLTGSFTTYVFEKSQEAEFYGLKSSGYFSLPICINAGEITIICNDPFTFSEANDRDIAIKNFDESITRIDALVQNEIKEQAEIGLTSLNTSNKPTVTPLPLTYSYVSLPKAVVQKSKDGNSHQNLVSTASSSANSLVKSGSTSLKTINEEGKSIESAETVVNPIRNTLN